MLNKKKLLQFLLEARTKTYAGGGGKVKPVFKGSTQREYRKGSWFYRDVYYTGKNKFMGLEVVYYLNKPVWSMSYYGSFKRLTEKGIDKILREALLKNWRTTRIWKKIKWQKADYQYICQPDFEGSIDELAGTEKIFKQKKEIYTFFYAGGLLI
ncbi:MAG: DUF5680 domain-containing protein [Candidatus Pacebacteria bacterium]|jgi:hypothetical protein|nr:DUF5680 domain-containing protein [Candidatus Paceibacterota bacterium]